MIKHGWVKLNGGSLQFVLFIGAVIAVLLLTFVLLTHTHFLFIKKTDTYIDLVKRTDLAIHFSLQNTNVQFNQQNQNLVEGGIQTSLEEKYWGVFKIIKATSKFQKNGFEKVVLTGGMQDYPKTALFLQDNNRPMVIAGKSKIIGDAFLPKQGIRPGNIAGQSFHGNVLVQGRQQLSTSSLPRLESSMQNELEKLFFDAQPNTQGFSSSNSSQREIIHSFLEPTLKLDGNTLDLSGKKFSGNIIIRSNGIIRIDASTQLTDVILVAPKIVIGDGFVGNFQAIASKEIQVGKNSQLKYPSALVVLQKSIGDSSNASSYASQPQINIAGNSIVQGSVCYLTADTKQINYPQIRIAENAQIIGQVYCNKNLELKGSVLGNVTTYGFVSLENGNVYQNHLFNGSIDVTLLPFEYVGISMGSNQKKGVAKCLY